MFRLLNSVAPICRNPTPVCIHSIRWKKQVRKPFWIGVAKSKRFYVPEAPPQSEEEYETLKKLFQAYRTQYKSARAYLIHEAKKAKSTTPETGESEEVKRAIALSLKINEEWNRRSSQLREERLALEEKEFDEFIIQQMSEQDLKEQQRKRLAERMIEAEKMQSASYITEENIDEAIERCLTETVNTEYAIDLNGKIYEGSLNEQDHESGGRQQSAVTS